MRITNAEACKLQREKRKREGRCTTCAGPVEAERRGKLTCGRCIARSEALVARMKKAGLCRYCEIAADRLGQGVLPLR